MKKRKIALLFLMLSASVLFLGACLPGNGPNSPGNPAGFFSGIWHGWIAPVSLILSIFNRNISIYEVYNKGFTYDFGFYMAIISGFGGLALSRRRKKHENRSGHERHP